MLECDLAHTFFPPRSKSWRELVRWEVYRVAEVHVISARFWGLSLSGLVSDAWFLDLRDFLFFIFFSIVRFVFLQWFVSDWGLLYFDGRVSGLAWSRMNCMG
jgi:hypothetical protein